MRPADKLAALITILGLGSLACAFALGSQDAGQVNVDDLVATKVAATLESQAAGQPPSPSGALPHSLYYQSRVAESGFQVFRLERDGVTHHQVTSESVSVYDYAVSPADGRVAYIAANQLYTINPDGSGRSLLVDGGPIDEGSDEFHYRQKLSGLSWSPDGFILAYGQNGVNLVDFRDGSSRRILENVLKSGPAGSLTPEALYFPNLWSPDGTRLLVSLSFLEGATLAVVDPLALTVTRLGEGIVCCYAAWSPDGASIVVGSPHLGLLPSGLWRYDAASGAETILLPTISDDDTLNFASWPLVLPDGELRYFFTNTPEDPLGELPLTMVRSAKDGVTGRVQLRSENWSLYEALWAADGSLVVAVEPYVTDTTNRHESPVILINTAGGSIHPLLPAGFNLQWGP